MGNSTYIKNRKELGNLISPQRNHDKPIYNWHSFKHSYSKELVDTLVSELGLKKGQWVMDPFCGGGTTLLACKELGINSHGFDILPFSVFLSNVKTRDYVVNDLKKERIGFANGKADKIAVPALKNIPIAKKAFTEPVRKELVQLKSKIEAIENKKVREFYNLGLLSILESVSNTAKSGGFLRMVERKVNPKEVQNIFLQKIDKMIADVQEFYRSVQQGHATALARRGDARKIQNGNKYHAVITSPPYPNRHDYSRIYSLEMFFDFVENNDDLKKIRYETLRSHVEAKKKFDAVGYSQPESLKRLLRRIEKNGVNNYQVLGMLKGYFEDMYLSLKAMSDQLLPKGKVALVVSNVRFSGVNIPVDEILLDVGKQAGLKPKAIWVARYRGNSSQQMRAYKRKPSRESVVIWEN